MGGAGTVDEGGVELGKHDALHAVAEVVVDIVPLAPHAKQVLVGQNSGVLPVLGHPIPQLRLFLMWWPMN